MWKNLTSWWPVALIVGIVAAIFTGRSRGPSKKVVEEAQEKVLRAQHEARVATTEKRKAEAHADLNEKRSGSINSRLAAALLRARKRRERSGD